MQGRKAHASAQTAVHIRLVSTRNGRTNRTSLHASPALLRGNRTEMDT